MRWVDNSPTCALIGECKRHFRVIRQKYLLFAENGENNSCIIFSVVASVVVVAIFPPKARNLAQEGLVKECLLFAKDGENNSCIIFSVVAAVAVAILAPKASNLAQECLVLSPELSIHDTINEWVDSATQIDQEPVRQVNLSWYRRFSARGVHVIHNGDRKPAAREAKQNCH